MRTSRVQHKRVQGTNETKKTNIDNMLSQEYKRFLYINEMKNIHHSNSYEYLNSLDALFIDMANHIRTLNDRDKIDKVLINLKDTHPIWEQFTKRMKYKRMNGDPSSLKSLINSYLQDSRTFDVSISKIYNSISVKVPGSDPIKFKIPKRRLEVLQKKGSLKQIALMILRYQCLVPRGNHWNIPLKFYKHIYEHEGVRLEGFSSPLNSQLTLIADDVNFCSLFPDTDEVFGSIGSFFDLDYEPESISFNPPYTEYIINEGIKKTLTWKNTKVIYNLPHWTNMEGYDRLNDLDVPLMSYGPGEFYYESEGKKIMFKGSHYMYALRTDNPEQVFNSIRPTEFMVKDYEQNGRLTHTQYHEAEELSQEIISDSLKLLSIK